MYLYGRLVTSFGAECTRKLNIKLKFIFHIYHCCTVFGTEHVKEQGSKSIYYIEETLENNVQENLPILKLTGQMTSKGSFSNEKRIEKS